MNAFNYHFEMEIQQLSEVHRPAFLKMMIDLENADPSSFAKYFARKAKWSEKEFDKFVKEAEKEKLDWRPGANKTSVTRYIMPGKFGEILAFGIMQFPLDEKTEKSGGNLICIVPPGIRKHGYGSYCLALMLFEAVRAGLRRVLVTCAADDLGARKMIEKNRGVLTDEISVGPDRDGSGDEHRDVTKVARYWIQF